MHICDTCGQRNVAGSLICSTCATPFDAYFEAETSTQPTHTTENIISFDDTIGTLEMRAGTVLALLIDDGKQTKTVRFPKGHYEVLIGRADGIEIGIDLNPFAGYDLGVSRRHARVFVSGGTWMIEDLNSSNGTFLNEKRLKPQQPFVIHSGDEITFGRLHAKILLLPQLATAQL